MRLLNAVIERYTGWFSHEISPGLQTHSNITIEMPLLRLLDEPCLFNILALQVVQTTFSIELSCLTMPSITTEAVTLLNAWFFRDAFIYEKIIKNILALPLWRWGPSCPNFLHIF